MEAVAGVVKETMFVEVVTAFCAKRSCLCQDENQAKMRLEPAVGRSLCRSGSGGQQGDLKTATRGRTWRVCAASDKTAVVVADGGLAGVAVNPVDVFDGSGGSARGGIAMLNATATSLGSKRWPS